MEPNMGSKDYGEWSISQRAQGSPGAAKSPSNRAILKERIDFILKQNPKDFQSLLDGLREAGYKIKPGAHIAVSHEDFTRNIRLKSLGAFYAEENLRRFISSIQALPYTIQGEDNPLHKRQRQEHEGLSRLIDIQSNPKAQSSTGYKHWARLHNVKQLAGTLNYMESSELSYEDLAATLSQGQEEQQSLISKIREVEARMTEINALQKQIGHFAKTKETFAKYKSGGYRPAFYEEHRGQIEIHRAAKKYFSEYLAANGLNKLPAMADLKQEYATLKSSKNEMYSQYNSNKNILKEMATAKSNLDLILQNSKARSETSKSKNSHDLS